MKHSLLFTAIIALFMIAGCTEEELPSRPPDVVTPPAPDPLPPPPIAGEDMLVELLASETTLIGFTVDSDPGIRFSWKKISGPNSFLIVSKDSLQTRLTKLEKGVYEFELTVSDKKGMTSKDTAMVIVGALSQNPSEVILNDQALSHFYDYSLFEIENIHNYIPRGSFFKFFVRRDATADWEEVLHPLSAPDSYRFTFWLMNGAMSCYAIYTSGDMPSISEVRFLYD